MSVTQLQCLQADRPTTHVCTQHESCSAERTAALAVERRIVHAHINSAGTAFAAAMAGRS